MDVKERLTKQGKDLGYEGETLQTFVKEQQIELRNQRKAIRELSVKCAKLNVKSAKQRQNLSVTRLELMGKIEAQKRYAVKEAYEAETAKREAEELSKREELEIMERIEREKHDIEREKHDIEREKIEAAEK